MKPTEPIAKALTLPSGARFYRCALQVNPFDYLTELQRHSDEVARNPAAWLPWNYREALGGPGVAGEIAAG